MRKVIVMLGGAIAMTSACSSEDLPPVDIGRLGSEGAISGDSFFRGAVAWPNDSALLGRSFDSWIESWWRWTFSVPAERNPELVLDADCGVDQAERVYFVPLYDGAKTFERTCRVPFGKPVLFPVWAVINDYPCPDPTFEPAPGQTLDAFLREGAMAYTNLVQDFAVQWNGRNVDLGSRRNTGHLFEFQAHRSLVGKLPDPCLRGTMQPGVSDGYWLMVLPSPGEHVVRVRATHPSGEPIDQTYRIKVLTTRAAAATRATRASLPP
jgi:hypothetical protein